MVNLPNLFQQMKVDKYYKFIASFSGIILIMSIFIEVKNIDIALVTRASFLSLIYSVGIWLWEDIKKKK